MFDQRISLLLILLVVIVGSFLRAVLGFVIGKYGLHELSPSTTANVTEGLAVAPKARRYASTGPSVDPFAGDLVSLVAGVENYDPLRFAIVILAAKIINGTALVYFISFFSLVVGSAFLSRNEGHRTGSAASRIDDAGFKQVRASSTSGAGSKARRFPCERM